MNKIVSTKNTSVIFLATVLVLGTIATISPSFMLGAQAEQYYGMDDRYDSYEPDYSDRNNYEPTEYPSYKPEYPSDNSYKSKDSSNTFVKKVKCNNINSNNNGVDVNLGIPSNDALAEAQADNEGQAATANGWGYGDGYKQNDNGFKFVCINNNDSENNIIVINETIPEPPPEPTITCEECFEENLPPAVLVNLNTNIGLGIVSIVVDGQIIQINNLAELCSVLQGATVLEAFTGIQPHIGTANAVSLLIICLAEALDLDLTFFG